MRVPTKPNADALRRFAAFVSTGAASALAALALLYAFVDVLGMHYLVGYGLTFLAVNGTAYFVSRRVAFPGASIGARTGLMRFYALSAASVAANGVLLTFAVESLHVPYLAAAATLMVANAPVNFLLHRRYTFRPAGP